MEVRLNRPRVLQFLFFIDTALLFAGAVIERASTSSPLPTFGEDRVFNGSDARYLVSVEAAGARAAIAADFDGDGSLDLVVASSNDNTVAWYRRLEDGSYGAKQMITRASNGARIVAVGDIDQDNLIDVVSASYYDHTVRWFRNLGGYFGPAQVITTVATGAQSVSLADIDNDGDLDVLSGSSGDNSISWYENLGDNGRFCEVRRLVDVESMGIRTVLSVDLDHDGLPDLAAASKDDDTIAWYRNLGDGSFVKHVIDSSATGAYSLVAKDVDEDGLVDLVTAANMEGAVGGGEGGKVSFYRNQIIDGLPVFTKVAVTSNDDFDYFVLSVWAGDLDGDGDVDIASASFGLVHEGSISWYENLDGDGLQWERHRIYEPLVFNAGHYVFGADMDGDGDNDLVAVTHSDNKVQILYASTPCDWDREGDRSSCCPQDHLWNGSHCIRCAPGTYLQANSCLQCPTTCPHAGLSYLPAACHSIQACGDIAAAYKRCDCSEESFLDYHTFACLGCPSGFIFPRTRNRTVADYNLEEVVASDGTVSLSSDLSWEAFNFSQDCVAPSCDPGSHFAVDVGTCMQCPAGRFSPGGVVTQCTSCPSGSACIAGSVSPQPCLPGYFAQAEASVCTPSPAGYIVPAAKMSAATACAAGSYSAEVALSKCTLCSIGSYNSEAGQSECISCGAQKSTPRLWTSMRLLQNGAEMQWVLAEGSESEDNCGCQPGARAEGDDCVDCGEGLECHGMNDTRIEAGYFSSSDVSVFQCSSSTACPGGVPGDSCRDGHKGILCAECESGMTLDFSRLCKKCESGDKAVAWISMACLLCLLVMMYVAGSRYQRVNDSYLFLLAGLVITQGISVVQQLNITSSLNLRITTRALRSVLGVLELVALDIGFLRVGCITEYTVLQQYLGTMLLVWFCLGLCVCIHLVARTLCSVSDRNCLGLMGSVCAVLYITVLSRCLAPFQCFDHPNDMKTVQLYPSVLCWTDGSYHLELIAIGIASLVMPIGFLALVCRSVLALPSKMREGDTGFLDAHGFLFSRFRPHTYWFVLVIFGRNTLLAIAQVVPEIFSQIMWLMVVQIGTLLLTMCYMPWRIHTANYLDLTFTIAVILVIQLAGFYAQGIDEDAPGVLLLAIVVGVLLLIPCTGLVAVVRVVSRRWRKPYQFFLSHHKAKAGTFARLLKLFLHDHPKVRRKVFLDVDNLTDLDTLFDHVRDETQTVLILCTLGIYLRPWCLGEIVTAHAHQIPSFCIHCEGWQEPDAETILQLPDLVELQCLHECGIGVEMIESSLLSLRELPFVKAPEPPSIQGMEMLVYKVVANDYTRRRKAFNMRTSDLAPVPSAATRTAVVPCDSEAPSTAKSLARHHHRESENTGTKVCIACADGMEAVSGAMILQYFLLPYMFQEDVGGVTLLRPDMSVPRQSNRLLFFCTQGCLQSTPLLEVTASMLAWESPPEIIPITGDDMFEFPRRRKQQHQQQQHSGPVPTKHAPSNDSATAGSVSSYDGSEPGSVYSAEQHDLFEKIFKEIALPFYAKTAHLTSLQAQLDMILQRIQRKRPATTAIRPITPRAGHEGDDHPEEDRPSSRSSRTSGSALDLEIDTILIDDRLLYRL